MLREENARLAQTFDGIEFAFCASECDIIMYDIIMYNVSER